MKTIQRLERADNLRLPNPRGLPWPRRRHVVAALGGGLALLTSAVAQNAARVLRLAILEMGGPDNPSGPMDAFMRELELRGFVEGSRLVIDRRFAYGDPKRLRSLADELVALHPDVIFTASGSLGALAAKSATSTIPIVFDASNDPVGRGLVVDLARPGGNLTGTRVFGLPQDFKRLQMLVDVVRAPLCVAIVNMGLGEPSWVSWPEYVSSFAKLGLGPSSRLLRVDAQQADDLPGAFESMRRVKVDALVVSASPVAAANTERIAVLALQYRLPAIADGRRYAESGLLMTYSTDWAYLYRRAADYISRILNGMSPGDLPIEQATKFELVINLKTARLLNVHVPRSMLLLADAVIE